MENVFANIFYITYNALFTLWENTCQIIWTLRNKDQLPKVMKLQKQVLNELEEYGIYLPTKFEVTTWQTTADHDPNSDIVHFPLAYINPRFRFHGSSCINYIRHEYGHACIEHYWAQEGINGFRDLFGDYHQPYEEWLFICWRKRRFDWKNYITKYAQVHPAEDFAECFFTYLQKGGNVKYLKKNRPLVYEKMLYVEKVLFALSGIDFSGYNDLPTP